MLATSSAPASRPALVDQRAIAAAAVGRLKRDYTAWAARCYRIRDKFGKIRPLTLNDGQQRISEIEQEELRKYGQCRGYILKARQGGFSTDQQARALHQIWREPNFDALTLAHTKEDTEKLFAITQRAIEHFPVSLLPRLGDKATSEISFPGLDSVFFTGTAGSKRTGRGMTLKRFHGSEFAFWDDPEGTLASVGGALVPGSTVWLETTASGVDSDAHKFWKECEARGYRAVFFPWWVCDRVTYRLPLLEPDELGKLTDEEQLLVAAHGLSLEQLKWRRSKMKEFGRSFFLTEWAEDAESCWAAVGGMFYDADLLKGLSLDPPTPICTEMGGALRIYSELQPGERAIMGGDTAEGGSDNDRSTQVYRAFPSWRLLAEYEDSRVQPKEYAAIANTLGRRFGTALLVIEKNMHGITVLRHLRDDHHYPIGSIYHRIALDTTENEPAEKIGWATTAESKPLMLDAGRELLNAARDGHATKPSAATIRDAYSVRRGKDGKYDLGGRDMLVAEMLAWIGRSAPSSTGLLDFYAQQTAALRARREAQANGVT